MGSAACAEARAKVSEALAAVDELERGLPVHERSLTSLVRPLSLAIAELTAEVEHLASLRNEDNVALANLFAQTATEEEIEANAKAARDRFEREVLPGPYKTDPSTGQTMRLEYEVEKRDHVVVTDVLGGHEMTVSAGEWESWPEHRAEAA